VNRLTQKPGSLQQLYRYIPLGLAAAVSLFIHAVAILGLPDLQFPEQETPTLPLEARLIPLQPEPEPEPEPIPEPPLPRVTPRPSSVPPPVLHAPTEESIEAAEAIEREPVLTREDSASNATAAPTAARPTETPEVKKVDYPFRSVSLTFDLHYGESGIHVGEVKHRWVLNGDRYIAESRVEAVGLAALFYGRTYIQRSEGTINASGLMPMLYTQIQSDKEEERVEFDWGMGMATLVRGSRRNFVPLNPGTQDVISVLHQLYFLRPIGANSTIAVATPNRLDMHLFELLGEEIIEVPAGSIRSLHLKRHDPEGSITEVWLDRDRSLLPVRIFSINRKGIALDYRLQSMVAEHQG
jgi:hypothetical protein